MAKAPTEESICQGQIGPTNKHACAWRFVGLKDITLPSPRLPFGVKKRLISKVQVATLWDYDVHPGSLVRKHQKQDICDSCVQKLSM